MLGLKNGCNMDIYLDNTLTGKKERFESIGSNVVKMYNCGPTVYYFPHIGNMRSYVFANILRKMFEYFGYEVKQVINITDVGHLVSDGDEGEDKIQKEAEKEGRSANEIARFYEDAFYKDLKSLYIETEDTKFPRATEHIKEQIEIIKILEEKGFTYSTSDGVYFDTSKFHDYGKLGRASAKATAGKEISRIGENSEKKNVADFALWKFSQTGKEIKRLQEWESPWGTGFPGWHIECSAMSRKYLGQPFDIHTGGIDHIPVHHNNEIAQSECAFGLPLANFWLHNEFLKVDGQKMSKSLGNIYTIKNLIENKVHPLSFRYWLLTSHYSTGANFTWESVRGTQSAFEKIISNYPFLLDSHETDKSIQEQFEEAIADNLNTPIAISLLQEAKSKEIIDQMDKVLGLNIRNVADKMYNIPEDILELKKERDVARAEKNWQESDQLRNQIEESGYILEDRDNNSIIRKTLQNLL